MQDHQFQCPECPLPSSTTLNGHFNLGMTEELWPLRSLPSSLKSTPRQRRRAPSPSTSRPQQRGKTAAAAVARRSPYAIPSEGSAFSSTFPRATRGMNLFRDFMATLPRPFSMSAAGRSTPPSPVVPPSPATPFPDIMLELYSHTRHPLDLRTHLTILPSCALKAEKERRGYCVICYGGEEHLQIECKRYHTMKVCCSCVVGVYQSSNSCPVCRFRGEFRGVC